jgi:hypothetical protein
MLSFLDPAPPGMGTGGPTVMAYGHAASRTLATGDDAVVAGDAGAYV